MKKIALLLLLISILPGCQNADEPQVVETNETQATEQLLTTPLPSSMKGYELYSWANNGIWHYTLITGTNRNKTYEEVTSSQNTVTESWIKVTVKSCADLKRLLQQVPEQGTVLWSTFAVRTPGFAMPPSSVVDEVKQFCATLPIKFQVFG